MTAPLTSLPVTEAQVQQAVKEKSCAACHRTLPQTTDYFETRHPGGPLRGICRGCRRSVAAAYRAANRDRLRAAHKAWRDDHPENTQRYRDQLMANDPERKRRYAREWLKRNPDYARANRLNDLARRVYRVSGTITKEDITAAHASQGGRCAYCMKDLAGRYTVDHIFPMSRGGVNVPENIVVACRSCNASKGKKSVREWTSP